MVRVALQLIGYATLLGAAWMLVGFLIDLADPVAPGTQRRLPPAGKTALVMIVDEDGVTAHCYTTPDRVSSDIIYIQSHAYLEATFSSLGCEPPPAT
jgi:hypothetical protein